MKHTLLLIEGPGIAMDLVKQHIKERLASEKEATALIKQFGAVPDRVWRSRYDGKVFGLEFEANKHHPDFKKQQKKGGAAPKKGTEADKVFRAQTGFTPMESLISKNLKVPTHLNYKTKTGEGSTMIGNPFNSCGFLYLSKDGPYAMHIPDVQAEVKAIESQAGAKVTSIAKRWKPNFEGCRVISDEEWNLIVAKYGVEKKAKKRPVSKTAEAKPNLLKCEGNSFWVDDRPLASLREVTIEDVPYRVEMRPVTVTHATHTVTVIHFLIEKEVFGLPMEFDLNKIAPHVQVVATDFTLKAKPAQRRKKG